MWTGGKEINDKISLFRLIRVVCFNELLYVAIDVIITLEILL